MVLLAGEAEADGVPSAGRAGEREDRDAACGGRLTPHDQGTDAGPGGCQRHGSLYINKTQTG